MKLGAYTACLHDHPLPETLALLGEMGLNSAEVNAGGFVPAPHLPVEQVLSSTTAREEYLGQYDEAGITLTALNVNGNPLHPDPDIGPRHAQDLRRAIEVAAALGVRRVVAMSGLPAAHEGGRVPAWNVEPWNSVFLDSLDYQWKDVVIPFWADIQSRASAADVNVCIEMHPHNVVFNPPTMLRLATEIGATHVGAEMDPSHLFWQGIDPIAAIEWLGELVLNAAAKDTLIHPDNTRVFGVLDDRFTKVPGSKNPVSLGGTDTLSGWPEKPSWEFVAVGRGHDKDFWARFLTALARVDPGMAVNIEHEDQSFDNVEGLRLAASNLLEAADVAGLRE